MRINPIFAGDGLARIFAQLGRRQVGSGESDGRIRQAKHHDKKYDVSRLHPMFHLNQLQLPLCGPDPIP